VVTARTALLQALREGPGYGRELVRRVRRASAGRLRFAEGSIYPALRSLEVARLVRSWGVVPGRRRGGRARTYYELTERGVRASESDRAALLRLAAPAPPRMPDADECRRMRERIDLGAELSETALQLSARGRRPRGRHAA
jgi:DNA-binding PadR family transcriptional regulator